MVNSVQPRNQMNSAVDQIGHLHLFEVIWTVTAPSNEFTINADNRVNIQCDTYKRLCHYSSDFLVCLNNEFSKQVPHNIFTRFERGLNLNTGWCLDSFSRKPGKNVTARNGFFIFNTRIFRKSFEIWTMRESPKVRQEGKQKKHLPHDLDPKLELDFGSSCPSGLWRSPIGLFGSCLFGTRISIDLSSPFSSNKYCEKHW